MKILFTICGRAGSKGFKNKNLKEMNGVPLVYYTLAVIKLFTEKHSDEKVVVALNTDSEPLVELVKKQTMLHNIFFVDRKEELAGDKVAKVDVIRDTYFEVSRRYAEDKKEIDDTFVPFDVIVDLDLTSPLRTVEDVENCISEFMSDDEYDLVTTVVPARRSPYFNMVEKKDKFYRKICESDYTTRQEAPTSYELNASIYAYRPAFLEKEITNTILDYQCGISVMKDYLVLDIDSEEDFWMMEFLHRFWCRNERGISEVFETVRL